LQVTIDGINIKKMNLKWLRSQIGLVSQEPVMFNGSLLENIKVCGPSTP
jgi:ATP-binding cassette subfamily B (MDR/TAP) protein 1